MTPPQQVQISTSKSPTDNDLANYARAYIGAYLSAVRQENPDHIPKFAQEHPYAVEVCLMPNQCFVMLFEKSENSSISVTKQDWEYVNGRVMSGLSYLVTVYPHEGFHLKDASYRGKRDAVRDIRVFENSDLVDATRQLERLLTELADVSKWNKNPINMAELAMTKLGAIKHEVMRAGPSVDFMSMVEGLKNYKSAPDAPPFDPTVVEMIATVEKDFKDLGDVVEKSKTQDARIEELQMSLKSELEDFKAAVDKKMAKGLAVVLTTADRKIDKAVGTLAQDLNQKSSEISAFIAQKQQEPEVEVDLEPLESKISTLSEEIVELKRESESWDKRQIDLTPLESKIDGLSKEIIIMKHDNELRDKRQVDLTPLEPKIEGLSAEITAVVEQLDRFQALMVDQLRSDIVRLGEKAKSLEDYLIATTSARKVVNKR
ncbi:MAG: hypothetical protein A3K76_02675 [Euryarchaeota archaeon RBG_13_57_23]|nr:MAG: hypothetical protein A3K76_02675 [Euryarchaeota archaeon RBG_13_57_23]